MQDEEEHPVVPFRHRHDGWTADRRRTCIEQLAGTGCVKEACRAAGLSTTSAYRAYQRMPDFAMVWERALAARRPMLEDAAFERAIHGVNVPLTRLGQVVGERRSFSDGLLRFLIEREDRRDRTAGEAKQVVQVERATAEETDAGLTQKLDMLAKRLRAEKRTADRVCGSNVSSRQGAVRNRQAARRSSMRRTKGAGSRRSGGSR